MTTTTTTFDGKFGVEIEFTNNGHSALAIAAAISERGVECRAEVYNHHTRRHWKIVTDASVMGGLELVSPILYGEDGLRQIEVVSAVLVEMGCSANRSCGLHVHHDASGLTLDNAKNLLRLYAKYEDAVDEVMPPSRRGDANSFCRSIKAGRSLQQVFGLIASANSLRGLRDLVLGTRYRKLNLDSYWAHGTVEFRHHSGTVEAEKITNWVKLTANMLKVARERKRVKPMGAGKFDNVLRLAPGRQTRKFYRQRRAALAA